MTIGVTQLVAQADARADEPTAAQLSDQAYTKYEAGDFPGAVALYMKAYAISVDARILFNVAQIYDKKVQDRDLALEYYRRYLKSTTTEEDLVRKATARVTELQRQVDSKAKPEAPPASNQTATPSALAPKVEPVAPRPAAEATSSPPYWIGYTVAGLFAAGGAVTGALAISSSSDLKKMSFAGATPPSALDSASSKTKTMAIASDVLLGAAVVSLGVTLVVQLTAKSPKDAKAALNGPSAAWRF